MNQYVEELLNLAENNFDEYRKIKQEIDDAEAAVKKTRENMRLRPMTPVMKAEQELANQKLQEARGKLSKFKWKSSSLHDKAVSIQNRYAKSLEDKLTVNPEQLDLATVKLLESGIMKPNDYIRLFESARQDNNITMMRVIAKHAHDYNDRERLTGEAGTKLRIMEGEARRMVGGDRLNVFAGAVDAFARRLSEPMLINTDTWDTVVKPSLESLDD